MDKINLITFEGWQLGPLFIHVWGLTAALGVITAVFLALKKRREAGIKESDFYELAFMVVVSIFLFARILYVLEMRRFYPDLISVFRVWEGGFSLFGGVIGGVLAGIL